MRISVISLGCCKNRVDTEQALFVLRQAGHTFVEEKDADAVLINTCGFLAAAKEEALETIAEVKGINPTAQIIAVGCLAQREPELLKNIPGVTATLGIGKHLIRPRILSTSPDLAYLRIADGCDNRCAYCAIPDIRGPYRAAPFDDILNEAKHFVQGGVKELCVVAQDTTRYPRLPDLLCALADIDADVWVRFLYAYPEMITPELLDAIESRPNICRYIDVPIQHTHDDILRSMNRRSTTADLANMMKLIRKRKEKYALRTTVICGFPGETPAHHKDMLQFLREHSFDRLGAFAYSREQGTPAYEFPGQLEEKTKQKRLRAVMRQQEKTAAVLQRKRIGSIETVLIEGLLNSSMRTTYVGRTQYEAPEIDGKVFVESKKPLLSGQMIKAKITDASTHDLFSNEVIP